MMAKKKADQTGVPPKEVRQAISMASIWTLIKVKVDSWKQSRVYRQRTRKAKRTKAAKLLGISPDKRSRRVNWPRILKGALLLLILLWVFLGTIWLAGRLWEVPSEPLAADPTAVPTAIATNAPALVPTSVGSEPDAETVYLRVETLEVDTVYGIWRRMPGVGIFLAPAGSRDQAVRQVTEELLTEDGFLVAATTFETQPGVYWVWVDDESLPAGCAVWVPRFAEDAQAGISATEDLLIDLVIYPGFNTAVVKFQIVCGLEVETVPTVVNTSPPGPSPTPGPTDPPPTTPPPTDPPAPPPTPEPTEVICECETPETPLPTPEYEATPTPER